MGWRTISKVFVLVFAFCLNLVVTNINLLTGFIRLVCSTPKKLRAFVDELFNYYLDDTSSRLNRRRELSEDAIERGNNFIDKLLKDMIQDRGDEYDPYYLEDSIIGFSKKIVFVNVSGEAKLHDGYMTGLKTLHRPEHCSLEERQGRLYVKADLGAGALDFHYSGSAKFMNFGPTIHMQGTLSYVEVFMEFNVDSTTGRDGKLSKFTIDDMRGMKVWVTGLGPLNWALNPIISAGSKLFKRFLKNLIENKIENHISERLPNFQFPVEGVDDTTTEGATTETVTKTSVETQTPGTEEPTTEEPDETVEPTTEEPEETEEPITAEPITEEPEETEEPITVEPITEEPEETEEPITVEPITEEQITDEPGDPIVAEPNDNTVADEEEKF